MSKFLQGGAAAFKTKFLHNYIVLYFVVFITFFNLVSYAIYGNYVTLAIFFMVAIITSFFSKNMMIIFFIALTVTNILKYGTKIRHSEGFEDADESDEKETNGASDVDISVDKKDGKETETKYNKNKISNNDSILKPAEKVTSKEILSKLNKIIDVMKN